MKTTALITSLIVLTALAPTPAAGDDPGTSKSVPVQSPTDLRSIGLTVKLDEVVRLVALRNPTVLAGAARWSGSREKRAQVTSLPDPRIEWMSFTRQMMPENERWGLSLSQSFPVPAKLSLAGRVADRESRQARLRYEMALRNALSEAKEAFFELYYIDRARRVTGEVLALYERYASLAVGGDEAGQPRLPETFRAESQKAQLAHDLILLTEMRRAEVERLRGLLGAPEGTPIGATSDVVEPTGDLPPLEHLQSLSLKYNQELASSGVEVDKARDQVRLARLAPLPELMIGTRYMGTGGKGFPEGDPTSDPVVVTAEITLPIWYGKYRAMAREARQNETAARFDQEAQKLQVRTDLARAYFTLSNASRLVRLYGRTLLPQARQALGSAESLYRNGATSMFALIEVASTVHNFELARLRALADLYQNVARIERIVGTAIELAPAQPDAPGRPDVEATGEAGR
ncbi:MAG: TolC family protein [Candidatus Riflebacteria bacterium]|nr:TolC family protein [Candidatus Riflebacteria bacterium]